MATRISFFLAVVLGMLASPLASVGQQPRRVRPSSFPLEGGLGSITLTEEALARRLQGVRDLHNKVRELADNLLKDPELLKKLGGLDQEELERLRRKAVEQPGGLTQDEGWKGLLDKVREKVQSDPQLNQKYGDLFRSLETLKPPLPEPRPPGPVESRPPVQPPPPQGTNPPVTPEPELARGQPTGPREPSWIARQILKMADGLDDLKPEEAESLRDLARHMAGLRLSAPPMTPGGGNRWSGLGRWLSRLEPLVPKDSIHPRQWLSVLRNVRLPSLSGLRGATSGFRAPTLPSASRLSLGEAFGGVLWFAAGVALFLLAGKGLQMIRRPRSTKAAEEFMLGDWPVRPGAVRSREDLVKAFEYLALRTFGPRARPWHHLEIAAGWDRYALGNGARSDAARRLASVYERARYAPADEGPAPEDFTAARHDLGLLAGGPAV
jgi:hypothetical protein